MTWPMVPLGELATEVTRRVGAADVPKVYSVTKHSGFVPSDTYFRKSVYSRDLANYKLVKQGEFAYATIHLDEGSIGIAPGRAAISPMYTVFSADATRIDSRFLLEYLKSERAKPSISLLGKGAVHRRKSVSFDQLSRLRVPLPPLPEQRRIAAILDRAASVARAANLRARFALVVREAAIQRLIGEPRLWRDHWILATIGSLAESVQYGTAVKAGDEGYFPVLRMGNIKPGGFITFDDLKYLNLKPEEVSKFTVARGDLLFNRTNSIDHVGKAGVFDATRTYAFAGYLVRVRFHDPRHAHVVSAYLNSATGRALRRNLAQAAIGQANISAAKMKTIEVPKLSDEALEKVGRIVDATRGLHDRTRRLEEAAIALLHSLRNRAFKGEL